MSRFKVGDRVRRIKYDNNPVMRVGTEWIVSGFKKYCGDDYLIFQGGSDGNVNNFELVSPRFTVGDKVRCPSTPEAGIGVIEAVKPDGGYRVNFKDTWYAVCHGEDDDLASAYTSCAAAEVDNLAAEYGAPKPKFKVGDRVREIKGGAIGTVRTTSGDRMTINWDDGIEGGGMWLMSDYEHVAPATATLQIQAGKFYKTRDGRKVGPMKPSNGMYRSEFAFTVDHAFGSGFGKAWRVDGTFHPETRGKDDADLVAEWTDAPTTIADIVARHSQTGTAIVCLLENGKPKPATEPFVHGDAKAAEREALRLANANKGKEFGVYTLGEVRKVEKTFDHEWQRLAYGGERVKAVKALCELAGLSLVSAVKAVDLFKEDA